MLFSLRQSPLCHSKLLFAYRPSGVFEDGCENRRKIFPLNSCEPGLVDPGAYGSCPSLSDVSARPFRYHTVKTHSNLGYGHTFTLPSFGCTRVEDPHHQSDVVAVQGVDAEGDHFGEPPGALHVPRQSQKFGGVHLFE